MKKKKEMMTGVTGSGDGGSTGSSTGGSTGGSTGEEGGLVNQNRFVETDREMMMGLASNQR